MTTQLLIYESAVPVSHGRHAGWSVEVGADYGFSRNINSAPLMAIEFPAAAAEYTIVFAGAADSGVVMPVVVLGLHAQENLYLGAAPGWGAKYIPAFIRRYPFVFTSRDDGQSFTLCIDEKFAGFNQAGRGRRLFGEDGKPAPYVNDVLAFLQQYQAEFRRTEAFCAKLRELKLLDPMQAQLSLESGERLSLTGFMAVNRERLKALPPGTLAGMAATDELELIYLHLQSMRNFPSLRDRLASGDSGEAPDKSRARAASPGRSKPAGRSDRQDQGAGLRA